MNYQQSGIDESLKAAIERGDKWKSLAGELAKTIRVLHDMFEEVKDGEPNGKYVLNRHRFLVRDAAAKARKAGL